jgi:type I restriction enzyme S subunit
VPLRHGKPQEDALKPGWEEKKLREVLTLNYGKPLPASDRVADGLYPVFGANGVIAKSNKFLSDQESIIVGRKGSAGELRYVNTPFWPLDVTFYATINSKTYDPKFLYYFLHYQNLKRFQTGIKPGINIDQIYSLPIFIPNIIQQKRLVSTLDTALAELEKSKEQAKNYLTQAKNLFQAEINHKMLIYDNIYKTTTLGEISEVKYGYTLSVSQDPIGPKYLRITDIKDNNINWESIPYCCIKNKLKDIYLLKDNDIVFARTGTTTGKSFLVKNPPISVCASYLISLRIKTINLFPKFLTYFFKTDLYWQSISLGTTGFTRGSFNATKLSKLSLKIPELDRQRLIISHLDELYVHILQLEAAYARQVALHDELKRSILRQAFTGQL